jgi:acetyltransferase
VLAERRHVLTEMESKALLAAFHIPVTRTMLARSASEAMLIASQLGYPVALKIDSPDISHKSDVRGVALNVMTATQVRDTYNDMLAAVAKVQPQARINGVTIQPMSGKPRGRELYIGMTTDDPFGPVITFGAGGTMIELIADRAMELPPLNQFLAHRLIERARVAETLGSWRGAPPVDVDALEQVLLRVSEMVCALPQLREMDINPIILDESGAVAVDARIVVEPAALVEPALPAPGHPALPGRPGAGMAAQGRRAVHHPPHPARRRRHAAGPGARPVAGKPLLPLRQRDAGDAGAHAGALHPDRLRPRDGPGGGAPPPPGA